ncbi:FkbM family methyltransferase [Paracraurococcus lichenis]|uniref:FkbM family methyltransferase n=1 Tax=Paracraurococcus lichenis TaxID=3064888 RepID=A0ABT9E668_9PROT|nr:FkbM family methyltransferase [Paracraurococcus sp. LOR1-02]MDO9711560.1 FkbM family methyltransferase [Paracraurococcus sp. LOR1-02]
MSAPIPDLVYDIGLHRGLDTEFYLRKGFRVVAVEARPDFCADVTARFAAEVEAGRLTVVHAALAPRGGEVVSFFVNDVKDDWGSTERAWATKGGHEVTEITVPTVTLPELFDRHGVPRYLKCDIEGMDEECMRQLLADGRRPDFVSAEASSFDIFAYLRACGYDRAQLVNQAFHWATHPPQPPLEGNYAAASFTGHHSGLFGRELPWDRWSDFAEITGRWYDFVSLSRRDGLLAHGWLDVHACRAESLGG